jgi:filamentous hemagglutinin
MTNVRYVDPRHLISRQTPIEMSGNKIKRLRKIMKQTGFNSEYPIEVAEIDGKLIIIDGHHRAIAAKQEKIPLIPIILNQVSSEQAEQMLIQASEAYLYQKD